ncbi:hypothetical protein K1719_001105 [Acacia pycnantha]|nr:hypothetical protein K1719_001105 [Acacia pycnantha]
MPLSSKSAHKASPGSTGGSTDSHSLAERVRREKISERMKYLQSLVPGCNKIAGKELACSMKSSIMFNLFNK